MAGQLYLTFNPEVVSGSNITGSYSNPQQIKTEHYIPATAIEVQRWRDNPNNYRIENGSFVRIRADQSEIAIAAKAQGQKSARNDILAPLEIGDRTYTPDLSFQLNLGLALHETMHNPDIKPKMWCVIEGQWQFAEHDHGQLMKITEALRIRREQISTNLYT